MFPLEFRKDLSPRVQEMLAKSDEKQRKMREEEEALIATMTEEERIVYEQKQLKATRHMAKKMASGSVPAEIIETWPS